VVEDEEEEADLEEDEEALEEGVQALDAVADTAVETVEEDMVAVVAMAVILVDITAILAEGMVAMVEEVMEGMPDMAVAIAGMVAKDTVIRMSRWRNEPSQRRANVDRCFSTSR